MPRDKEDRPPEGSRQPRINFARTLKRECGERRRGYESAGRPYFLAPVIADDKDAQRGALASILPNVRDADEGLKILRARVPDLFEPRRIPDPDDGRFVVLEPMLYLESSRRRWWEVCSRQAEWTPSITAQGTLAPCQACHTRPGIEDCPDEMHVACADGVYKLIGGRKTFSQITAKAQIGGLVNALSAKFKMPDAGSYAELPLESALPLDPDGWESGQ